MTSLDYTQVKKIVVSGGYSWTEPRKLVFKELSRTSPQSTSSLITQLSKNVDRVSVYRTIDLFESLGIVKRINIGWKSMIELSDQFVAHHHHLSCLKCGQLIDIEDEEHINRFIDEMTAKFGFTASSHQFEIEGLCRDCQAKQRPVSA